MNKVTKVPSSMNMTAAINTEKVAHLGKNYASIDFEIKEQVNASDFKYAKMKPIIGTIIIGNRRVEVTYSELNNIMRTAADAMNLCDQSYRMGRWGKATR